MYRFNFFANNNLDVLQNYCYKEWSPNQCCYFTLQNKTYYCITVLQHVNGKSARKQLYI